ncbi:hypothetical protein RI129_005381 [Pyrocoelia pectoralis]|uniref:Cytochrome P450 n=1 Tax=Pyrocoelia pectoralis TaxID=417401 RepID=A0AAN7VFJ9_9COLE
MYEFYVKPIILLVIFAWLLYKYSIGNYKYWQKKRVQYVKPIPPFGNLLPILTSQLTLGALLAKYYNQFKCSLFGIYVLNKPVLVVRDPTLIKRILVKDFRYFHNRSVMSDEECDALVSNMLFFSKSPEWKYIRNKMTPIFTTGKMKNMFNLVQNVGSDMVTYLNKHDENSYVDAKEVCSKYSTDVISSCAFGINAHCFKSENSPFYMITTKMFGFNWQSGFNQSSYFLAHGLVKLFKMPFFDRKISNFLRQVFWDTLRERERTNIARNDVIDAMKDFKDNPHLDEGYKFEGDRILAQAMQFFSAGFETVGAAISFTLYELSLYPEIQRKLRLEIKNAVAGCSKIDYSVIMCMRYLHMVVQETLRKYPSLPFLERECAESYIIPEENLVLEPKTPVYIPLLGLHYDPEYFPDPEKYDPERFTNEDVCNSFQYLPFGDGPRGCIGNRFALMVTKIALVSLLTEFEVQPAPTTPAKIHFSPYSLFLCSSVGVPLKFKRDRMVH